MADDIINLSECVCYDPGDPIDPIMVDCDGWITLGYALELYEALGKAISLARKEVSRG